MKEKVVMIINEILENNGNQPITSFTGQENLRDDIGLTSMDLAELTVKIENQFGIDIFEDGLVENLEQILNKIGK